MKYIEKYLEELESNEISKSVEKTAKEFLKNHHPTYNYKDNITGLLVGEIQSGKTAQILGIISALADEGNQLFILLTSSITELHKQTYIRALESLREFVICNENDEERFLANKMKKPVLLVLKKNYSILGRWYNKLIHANFLNSGGSMIIIDDEADSSSLNTKVNIKEQSTINQRLKEIKRLSTGCLYLQVTATPQPIILLTPESGLRPKFVQYFSPGDNYIGGDFFYSDPASFVIRSVSEDELTNVRNNPDYIPQALNNALSLFILTASHILLKNNSVCNCLIHPGLRIKDHETYAGIVGEILNGMLLSHNEGNFKEHLWPFWNDLHDTKPDIQRFDKLYDRAIDLLENEKIKVLVSNSNSKKNFNYDEGVNILIGGNSLGRGVTIPALQTIYYTRSAKRPNADTFWQHCRMFGYDRDRSLVRFFLPESLLKMFTELNSSHKALVGQLVSKGIEGIKLIFPDNISPTRNNVIDNKSLHTYTGGVSYFPSYPKNKSVDSIDNLLYDYKEPDPIEIPIDNLIEILKLIDGDGSDSWNTKNIIECIHLIETKHEVTQGKLIVRRDRNITRGSRTMLSENDRALVDKLRDECVLVMYRLRGGEDRHWDNQPLWMPNINLPKGVYYFVPKNKSLR